MLVTETEVIDALRKARYYDNVVQSAAQSLRATPLQIDLKNNRTPLVLSIPFSADLTIEKLLDAAQQLMGIKLDWVNFPDLGTSCGPSLSLTVDRKAQSFSRKLSELSDDEREKLELWIKLVWRDELESKRSNIDGTRELYRMNLEYLRLDPDRVAVRDRGQEGLPAESTVFSVRIAFLIFSNAAPQRHRHREQTAHLQAALLRSMSALAQIPTARRDSIRSSSSPCSATRG